MSDNNNKSDYRPWIWIIVTSLFITFMTVFVLQLTKDMVKKRAVRKIVTVEERLEPFGRINLQTSEETLSVKNIEQPDLPEQKEDKVLAPAMKVELSAGPEHTIRMLNVGPTGTMVFDPAVIKVSPGDTLNFEVTDMAHNSTSIANMIPSGSKGWVGQMNQNFSVTLDAEGIYVYQCDPHLMMAMVGIIQVGDAVNLEEIKKNSENLKKNFAMNSDRLDSYLSQL